MRTHTNAFKNNLVGIRQADNKIEYTIDGVTKTLTSDEIYGLNKSTYADLFKTVMKSFEFETKERITNNPIFNLKSGILVNGNYEYLDYGNYLIKDKPEYDINTKIYKYTCYDKMLLTMVDYKKPVGLIFPINVREYITALAEECGLTFAKENSTFINYNKEISQDNFENGSYTYRDILDYLAQVVAGWFIINDDDELDIKYPTETNETFSNDYLSNLNVDFNKKYGPINSLVLSRSEGADNIYRKDDTSIATYGLTEIKFSDNPLLSGTDREDFIDEIFNKIKGLEFYIMDVETTGLMFLDIGDFYSFELSEDYHALKSGIVKSGIAKARSLTSGKRKCLMLNDIVDLSSGISEKTYTEEPNTSETDYKTASLTDSDLKNAILKVNKATAEIELKVSKNEVISAINLSPEEITINANKIKLEGYTTINGKFTIDNNGYMTATGGKIGNFEIGDYTLKGGTGNSQVGMCSTQGVDWAFWAGSETSGSAPFRVGHNGTVYASNINVTGGSIDIHAGNYYLTMGTTTSNPSVSGLNIGYYGVTTNSNISLNNGADLVLHSGSAIITYGAVTPFIMYTDESQSASYTAKTGFHTVTISGHTFSFYNGILTNIT